MSVAVPFLLYHSISHTATPRFRRWTVSPPRFAEHMAFLATEGYTCLTVGEYLRACEAGGAFPAKSFVLTFDDGFGDFVTDAMPIIEEHGLRATLFVTSGYIGRTSEWLVRERETHRPMMTWDDIDSLPSSIELGGHGYSHRQLDTLPADAALADLSYGLEVLISRSGRPVDAVAYPHGYSTEAIRRGLGGIGVTGACGVADAVATTDDARFNLPRLIVDDDTDLVTLSTALSGQGVNVGAPPFSARQRLWRWWRKARLSAGIDVAHVPR